MTKIEVKDGQANVTRAVLFGSRAKGMSVFLNQRDLCDYLDMAYHNKYGKGKIDKRKFNAMVKKINIDEYDFYGMTLGYVVR